MGGCKLAHQAAQTANRRQRGNEYKAKRNANAVDR